MTTFAPGDFSFLEDDYDVLRLTNAYKIVGQEALWDFFKTQTLPLRGGFMTWDAPEMARLKPLLDKVDCGHTAHSYVETLRTIQRIAKGGWEAYVAPHVEYIRKRKEREEDHAYRRANGLYIPAHWRTAAD